MRCPVLVLPLFCAVLAKTALAQAASPARSAPALPSALVTAQGDRVEIRAVPGQWKSLQFVEVCLNHGIGVSGPVSFDLASMAKPRYVSEAADRVCGRFAPIRQKFNLWKGWIGPDSVPVLQVRLDMSKHAGQRIEVYWLPGQQ